jgi:hypothetical protein
MSRFLEPLLEGQELHSGSAALQKNSMHTDDANAAHYRLRRQSRTPAWLALSWRALVALALIGIALAVHCVDRHRKRNPALSEAATCNPLEDLVYERSQSAPIGTPGYAKLRGRFNSFARLCRGPTFGADPHLIGRLGSELAVEDVVGNDRPQTSSGRPRRRGWALRPCTRISRSMRCKPHERPSARRSCQTRRAP